MRKKGLVILLAALVCFGAAAPVLASGEPSGELPAAADTEIEVPVEEVPAEDSPAALPESSETAEEAEAEPVLDAAPPGGGSSAVIYGGATEITAGATQQDRTYNSAAADQSALYINTKDTVNILNPTVTKTGSSSGGDNCNFYGQNATVLCRGGGTTYITGGTITSDATGANGVFSYGGNGGRNGAAGDGTRVVIRDTAITTTGGGSGGIMTTGGGYTEAYDLTITTSGQSSAPIRTDRGGGTVVVDGGTYTSNGLGSPVIYSTADITVKNATLVSNQSEGVCIEGKNSITLENCDFTVNNTRRNGNAKFLDSIMIYQSFSGDAASGSSYFTMTGGRLLSKNGHMFHVTNTNAVITLSGVELINEYTGTYKTLISVCDDGWSGAKNIATLRADGQIMTGGVLVGSNSTLTMELKNGSVFTGYFSGSITNYAGSTVSTTIGTVHLSLDGTSKVYLQYDAYLTSFTGDPKNVVTNGYTLYVNGVPLAGTTETEEPVAPELPAGDADGDGVVDIFDLIRVRKCLAGMEGAELNERAADVTGDGVVDIFDLIRLRKYLAGFDVTLG